MKKIIFWGAAAFAASGGPGVALAAVDCANLLDAGRQPYGVTLNSAVETPASDDIPVAHCLVRGTTGEHKGVDGKNYAIRFELRLPDAWNGRFVHQFNGGSDGVVVPALGPLLGGNKKDTALSRGYAVVASDAGHDGQASPEKGIAGGSAFGFDPQARRDYGYSAVATLNPLAESIVQMHYGRPAEYTYGVGVSNGGRHGLMAATRMPEIFDGILSGYPGLNLPKAAIQHPHSLKAWASVNSDISKAFSRDNMKLLADGILDACDALDGLVDGIVADSPACQDAFKLEALQCDNVGDNDCLSPAQILALRKNSEGPKNSRGEKLYSEWIWDPGMASANWRTWKLESNVDAWGRKPIIVSLGAPSLAQVFTTPPTAVGGSPEELQAYLLGFDFDRDAPKIFATDAVFGESAVQAIIPPDTDNPSLTAFRDAGNKMIVFHGNADPVFSVLDTIQWYRKLDDNHGGKAGDFVKLYNLPGMPHGAGGPSYDDFDFFSALVAWVESGKPPEAIVAGVTAGNKEAAGLKGKRFLYCPFPKIARFSGVAGDDESRFTCK